jgi:Lar family restriction alleviation protein
MTDEALLPCPFCAGSNLRVDVGLAEFVDGEVTCIDCGGNVGNHPNREDAIAAWNRRSAHQARLDAEIDACARECEMCPDEQWGQWMADRIMARRSDRKGE